MPKVTKGYKGVVFSPKVSQTPLINLHLGPPLKLLVHGKTTNYCAYYVRVLFDGKPIMNIYEMQRAPTNHRAPIISSVIHVAGCFPQNNAQQRLLALSLQLGKKNCLGVQICDDQFRLVRPP